MTRRELVEQMLRDAGPKGVTTAEFLRAGAGSRFGARIQELRDQGYDIPPATRVRDGEFRYVLLTDGPQVAALSDTAARVTPSSPPEAVDNGGQLFDLPVQRPRYADPEAA